MSRQIVNQHLQTWKSKSWDPVGRGSVTVRNSRQPRGALVRGSLIRTPPVSKDRYQCGAAGNSRSGTALAILKCSNEPTAGRFMEGLCLNPLLRTLDA